MPQVRLPFIPFNFLNDGSSPVPTGQYEPITGLELPSGLTPGAWFDVTEQEANALSDTNVGTLHNGRYQWLLMDPNAVNSGNGALTRGQALFWLLGGTTQYEVTNIEPVGGTAVPAAIFLHSQSGAAPVTPGQWFFAQLVHPGRATVKMASVLSNPAPAAWDSIAAANLGAGADAGLFDDIGGAGNPNFTQEGQAFGTFVGVAETAPVASGLVVVEIRRPGPVMN